MSCDGHCGILTITGAHYCYSGCACFRLSHIQSKEDSLTGFVALVLAYQSDPLWGRLGAPDLLYDILDSLLVFAMIGCIGQYMWNFGTHCQTALLPKVFVFNLPHNLIYAQ